MTIRGRRGFYRLLPRIRTAQTGHQGGLGARCSCSATSVEHLEYLENIIFKDFTKSWIDTAFYHLNNPTKPDI